MDLQEWKMTFLYLGIVSVVFAIIAYGIIWVQAERADKKKLGCLTLFGGCGGQKSAQKGVKSKRGASKEESSEPKA